MIDVMNPPSEIDFYADWLVTYRPTGSGLDKVLMERVLWFNGRDGDPTQGGTWTDHIVFGFRCCECRVLIFGIDFADFQHECRSGGESVLD